MRKALWTLAALSLAALATIAAGPPNLSSALEAQRQLVAERPDDATAHNDLGNLLLLARRPDEAEAAYRRAVEIDPARSSAHFNLGLLAEQRGERRAAMKEYKKVLEIDPRHAWAHYQVGALYEKAGNSGAATRAYARAFALDPQLAFPEVNPNVIDSKLTTAAMLSAYRSEGSASLAPTRYDNPQRIRDLFVAVHQPAPADTAAKAEPATPAAGGGGKVPAGTPTVLRPQNLQNLGSAGQVKQPGSSRSTGRQSIGRSPGGLQTWTRPEPAEPPAYEEPGFEDEIPVEEEEVPPPPPGAAYYRPGLPSTGRLDIRLIPGHRPTATAVEARVGRG